MHLGCCSTFGKRKNTLTCGSSIFTLSESLATSLVHGSRNPARKTIRYSFISAAHTSKIHHLCITMHKFCTTTPPCIVVYHCLHIDIFLIIVVYHCLYIDIFLSIVVYHCLYIDIFLINTFSVGPYR